jgi:2-phospho-L-lactate guanylyltransferase
VLLPLLPVKSLATSKGRLAPPLNPIERRLLTIAMLEDVIAAVQAAAADLEVRMEGERLARPVVISPDREVWRRADALGCRVVEEPPPAGRDGAGVAAQGDGEALNRSLARAVAEVAAGSAAGDAAGLLVVAADLPLASAAALERVAGAAGEAPVVVVPSHDGTGTNVLAWRDPFSFAPAFGPGSAARHLALPGAVRLGEPSLARDVDTVADLRAVAAELDPATVTAGRLRDLRGLAAIVHAADATVDADVPTAEE